MATTSPTNGKSVLGKATPGLFGVAAELGMSTLAYGKERGLGYSIGRGAVEYVAWQTAPKLMGIGFAGVLAGMAVPAAMERYENKKAAFNTYYRPNVGGTYKDTQQASTMRQASIRAISSHKLNARNALGQEATLMHRY